MFDTIAAISTGNSNQAISIIRISGPESFNIIKKITNIKKVIIGKLQLAQLFEKKELVDKVVIGSYKSPNSYTGEDVIEINAHGGIVNTQRILKIILMNKARLANPGEFSLRAFINGKINLIEAEGINNLIHAQSTTQLKIAAKNLMGRASQVIKELKKKLTNITGIIEVNIDYPEYDDIKTLTRKTLIPKLIKLEKLINKIINDSILTNKFFKGIKVAIIGKPNAGKSSLLNKLLDEDKAIITSVPGTTRDIVEGSIEISGVLYHFFDTAGIREPKNKIEKLGIQKTIKQIQTSDLILYLIAPNQNENSYIKKLIIDFKHIIVYTKSDLKEAKKTSVNISVKNNDIKKLLEAMNKIHLRLELKNIDVLISVRQQALLERAHASIKNAIKELKFGLTPDVVIVDLQEAWQNIANILGQANQEDLLTEMFSTFCLGK